MTAAGDWCWSAYWHQEDEPLLSLRIAGAKLRLHELQQRKDCDLTYRLELAAVRAELQRLKRKEAEQ